MRIAAGIGVTLLVIAAVYFLPSRPPQPPAAAEPAGSVSILFVGDMMFDRYIRTISERVGGDFIFSCIYHRLAEADFAVGNLEGPITNQASVSEGSVIGSPDNYRFTFPPSTAELLLRHRFEAVNLGNNHIANFGIEGVRSTREYLTAAGVGHFGGLSGDEPVLRKERGGVPLSFVSYNQFGGASAAEVASTVRAESGAGRIVVVYAHWGDEYAPPTAIMKEAARLFAENGATAVIGSHPHIVQEHEYIGNALVFYSLGNFIFDQYKNSDVSHGLAVLLHLSAEPGTKASVTEFPVILQTDGRTCERQP